ncbi:MAG: dihydrolipoamide acetyltransferase family protein [Actinomycetota bacterium]
MVQFRMPQLGETVLEATITKWLKSEGDEVAVDEPLVEVSTDKVDSEIPSPAAGKLTKLLVAEGETVPVGAAMAEIGGESSEEGGESSRAKSQPEPEAEGGAEPAQAKPSEPTPKPSKPAPAQESVGTKPPAEAAAAAQRAPAEIGDRSSQPLRSVLSPLVRRLAREYSVDLAQLEGSGSGGRITKQDVLQAAGREPRPSEPPAQAPRPSGGKGREERVQVSAMRRSIAEHMVASIQSTARAWNVIEVDLTRVGMLRSQVGEEFRRREGFSLTWTPFVSMALIKALLKFPELNSTWNDDGTVTVKHYVNLGMAVALENGLIVPVTKGADSMNLVGLARAIRDLAVRARNGKLSPDDVQGGTFTLTNPGGFGSVMSVPIINRGQAAILAFDAVVKRPVVVTDDEGQDSVGIRSMAYISIAWDHRIIDGAEAAKFLSYLKGVVEQEDFAADLGGLT